MGRTIHESVPGITGPGSGVTADSHLRETEMGILFLKTGRGYLNL